MSRPIKQRTAQRSEVTHHDFVLKLIEGGTNKYADVKKAFADDNRNPRSIDGALGKLKQNKLIGNSGPGEYKLLAKGNDHIKEMKGQAQ